MLWWMEYKEGGIEILLQCGKLNIMKWLKEFIVVNSQSLRFSSLFSKVESVDFMASWCHQQGRKDEVLKSTLNPPITSDLCFALTVVGFSWPVASEAPTTGVDGAGLLSLVLKSPTSRLVPVH